MFSEFNTLAIVYGHPPSEIIDSAPPYTIQDNTTDEVSGSSSSKRTGTVHILVHICIHVKLPIDDHVDQVFVDDRPPSRDTTTADLIGLVSDTYTL